jgi:uncharacterized protein
MAEVRLSVRVKPGSSRARVGGSHDGALVVSVHAQPVDGAANESVIASLAEALGLRTRQLRVTSGHTARTKVIAIETDSPEEIAERIADLLQA